MAVIHGRHLKYYAAVMLVLSLLGGALAARHIYIQSLPPELVPDCIPPLEYLVRAFPVIDILYKMLSGSGDCAEIQWFFLGMTLPGWSLIGFIFLGMMALRVLIFLNRKSSYKIEPSRW